MVDPTWSSRLSVHSFVFGFTGLLLREGLGDPKKSCEAVAEECLGKGNTSALAGKVIIVTGASSGLGLENTRVFLKYGAHVILAVRNPDKAKALLEELQSKETLTGKATILPLDLDDLATVKPFVVSFEALNVKLNFLVNNAGIMTPCQWTPSKQGYESQFATNHLAHFLLTELLIPKLRETRQAGGEVRVVILSSVAHSLCKSFDLDKAIPPPKEVYNGIAEYGISKAMNIFHCRGLQQRLAGDGIQVCAVHPGVIKTGLTREGNISSTMLYDSVLFTWMHKTVPRGAATTMHCVLSDKISDDAKTGTVLWLNCGPHEVSGVARPGVRDDLVEKVWKISEDLVEPFR